MTRPDPRTLRAEPDTPVRVARLGTLAYREAWQLQQRLVDERRAGRCPDTLLLLEHPRVYTLGRRAERGNVRYDAATLAARGIELVDVDRGGDVTYHGPGQLVGYPILRLAGTLVVDYVRTLEEVLIRALADLGVTAQRSPGYTGVWVGEQKVAAIGVRVAAGGLTSHGFALNVRPDLDDFAGIVPCGITDRGVCSLAGLGVDVEVAPAADLVAQAFAEVLGATLDEAGPDLVAPAPTASKAPP